MPIVQREDVYGQFLKGLASQQAIASEAQRAMIAGKAEERAQQDQGQLLTLRSLQIRDAQRKNEIAAATQSQALEANKTAAQTSVIEAADAYAQKMLDMGVPGQPIADNLIQRGILPQGTQAMKVPAPWDVSGRQKVWAFQAPGGEPTIFNEDKIRARHEAEITATAGADQKLLESGFYRTGPQGTIAAKLEGFAMPGDPSKLSEFGKLQLERDTAEEQGDYRRVSELNDQIGVQNQTAFEKAVADGVTKDILLNQTKARDAVQLLDSNREAIALLNSGTITGTGAEWLTSFGKALETAGFLFPGAKNSVENTQAFGAAAAKRVAKIISDFGAGTGLSDADREYAIQAAAGQITMSEGAIRKIIDITTRASQNSINYYNGQIDSLKPDAVSRFPLDPKLYVSPELMTMKATGPAAGVPKVKTVDDYNKLAPGTKYVDPDGVERIKSK